MGWGGHPCTLVEFMRFSWGRREPLVSSCGVLCLGLHPPDLSPQPLPGHRGQWDGGIIQPASTVPAQVPIPVIEEGGWTEGKVGSMETLRVRSLDGPPRGSGHPSLPSESGKVASSWPNTKKGMGTAQGQLVTWPARFSKDLQGRRSTPGPGWAVVVPGRDPIAGGSRPHPTRLVSSR